MPTDIQAHAQLHERNVMKPQAKWQDWSLVEEAGILLTISGAFWINRSCNPG